MLTECLDGHCSKFKINISNDKSDTGQTEQLKVISDMCVYSKDVVHDQIHMRLYYPLDEDLRNKGKLTLIHPSYCHFFSRILKTIKNIVKYMVDADVNIIIGKEII